MSAELNTSNDGEKVPPYSLELVANIAARLAVGRLNLNDNTPHLNTVAREAVTLLQACEKTLREAGQPNPRQKLAHAWSDTGVVYSKGSFRKGLLLMTKRDTETEALPLFKQFLSYREQTSAKADIHREQDIPPNAQTEPMLSKQVEKRVQQWLVQYRQEGFGGVRLEHLHANFSKWYEDVYIPNIKRTSGAKGGRPKGAGK